MKIILFFITTIITLCIATYSNAQTLPSYLPTNGLVGWWPFNGNANDESGNGNSASTNGTFASDRFNSDGSSVSLNGSNQMITIPGNNNLNTDIFSISFWTLPNALSIHNPIQYGIIGSSLRFSFYWSTNGLAYNPMTCSGTYAPAGNSTNIGVNLGNWQQLTYVIQGQTTTFYLNGILIGSQSGATALSCFLSNMNLYFGADIGGGAIEYYSGFFDDIAIYNRALTPEEITALYTATPSNNGGGAGSNAASANVPQGISYQAVARNAQGQPLNNTALQVKFTLLANSLTGTTEYAELHSLTTNDLGLFTTAIGTGTPLSGTFAGINWAGGNKFLKVEMDAGNGFVALGTQQLLSVPYSMRSHTAAKAGTIENSGLPVFANNAAAIAGGLQAGQMYRTATGDLKIVY